MAKVKWLEEPEPHDFPAASDYLDMLAEPHIAKQLTEKHCRPGPSCTRRPKTFFGRRS